MVLVIGYSNNLFKICTLWFDLTMRYKMDNENTSCRSLSLEKREQGEYTPPKQSANTLLSV